MKKHFQIVSLLLLLFLSNGNSFLYANTYQNSMLSLENKEGINNAFLSGQFENRQFENRHDRQFEQKQTTTQSNTLEKYLVGKPTFSNSTYCDALLPSLKSSPLNTNNKEVELSNFVKKEEKIKPIHFKYITVQTVITHLFVSSLVDDFYFVKNLNLVSYFKSFISPTYKRYVRWQVFRI